LKWPLNGAAPGKTRFGGFCFGAEHPAEIARQSLEQNYGSGTPWIEEREA